MAPTLTRWPTSLVQPLGLSPDALPRPCLLCGQWQHLACCDTCVLRFAPLQPRCPQCALLSPAGLHCGDCLSRPPAFGRAVAAADYDFPWDRLITAFKFHGQTGLANGLAWLLARALKTRSDLPAPDLVLPMPLSSERLGERGYNQAWELARRLPRPATAICRPGLLQRLPDKAHQVGAGRDQRLRNLAHVMWLDADARAALHGRQVALVDDVMTTGATAQAASLALLQAGAAGVQVWVLARTPRPEAA